MTMATMDERIPKRLNTTTRAITSTTLLMMYVRLIFQLLFKPHARPK